MAASHAAGVAIPLSACHVDEAPCPDRVPRWLRAWAVLTACAALPLVTLGAEVTTKQVGMVDQKGFRRPGTCSPCPATSFPWAC